MKPSSESSSGSGVGSRGGGFGFCAFSALARGAGFAFVAAGAFDFVAFFCGTLGCDSSTIAFVGGSSCSYCDCNWAASSVHGALVKFMSNVESMRSKTKTFLTGSNVSINWPSPEVRAPVYV